MKIDALAIRLRRRSHLEAADLGVRLCQSAAYDVYRCYLLALAPVAALALASYGIATWLPSLALWLAKPWLDRTILFVLSRAAFGQRTTPADLWQAQRQVWWSRLLSTWTVRRLSPWRSLTQPVHQLEGIRGLTLIRRARQIQSGRSVAGTTVTVAFSLAESALTLALISLSFWLAPQGQLPDLWRSLIEGMDAFLGITTAAAYAAVIGFLEPFYVAAGFGMYLNRRVELEAWDIEQEFRRALAS